MRGGADRVYLLQRSPYPCGRTHIQYDTTTLGHIVTLGFKAKSNAHIMCAHESCFHTYRIENIYRIIDVII
jgi:hypothetical protein